MTSSSFNCFGVRIDGLSAQEVLQLTHGPARAASLPASATAYETAHGKPPLFWIVTANPEILLYARSHPAYREALAAARLRVVDGFGLWLAGRLRGKRIARCAGVDLAEQLLNEAARSGQTVAFVGGAAGIAEQALEQQRKRLPGLNGFALSGGQIDEAGRDDTSAGDIMKEINTHGPGMLLAAFGHPKQEMWIARHLNDFPSIRVIMGVGGTFDYWSGKAQRAPAWMRGLGLEWLYRLIREPVRIMRILNAVFIFPFWLVVDLFSTRGSSRVSN